MASTKARVHASRHHIAADFGSLELPISNLTSEDRMTWQHVYESDAQGLWGLLVVPASFLLWRLVSPPATPGAEPRAAGFVRRYAVVFAVETLCDPIVTGPLLRWLGLGSGVLADTAMVPFVLLGDFRVFVLLLATIAPTAPLSTTLAVAAGWTCVVPAIAGSLTRLLHATLRDLPGTTLWLLYETAFAALALGWRAWIIPARATDRPHVHDYLRMLCTYVATYYALWAVADALIMAGLDLGWALRMVPNQLYYSFWLPVAVGAFFATRYAPASSSTQASR
jgi:hypothetical protein